MELNFPMESFLQVKQELQSDRNDLDREKAAWLQVRSALDETRANLLDEQFKAAFEEMGRLFLGAEPVTLQPMLQTLQQLVQQGASASLLGNHELGTYNLAMFIKYIPEITDKTSLDMAVDMIWLTIIAGADLKAQKAYVGNGGALCVELVCEYLGRGIGEAMQVHSMEQYECCYKIFPWLVGNETLNAFNLFIACLRDSPEVADLQEKIMLTMMCLGFSPFTTDGIYQSASLFSRIAAIKVKWVTILFPFEDDRVKLYLSALQLNMTAEVVTNLINGFTSSNKTRKLFKAFFSMKPHWLLQYIIGSAPETIFSLVKRNEQDLLVPFLKNYKPAMIALKDANGNTLLHQAVLCRGLVENTIQLLRNARLSPQAINNEGLTPLALAMKNNRTDIIKWLQ